MKFNKGIFLFLMLVLCSFSAFGIESFEEGGTVPLDATYSFAGVLTHANANVTITDPNGDIDLTFSNVAMNETATGVFYSEYNNTLIEGEYKALVVFYNDSWAELGRRTNTFFVGDLNLTDLDVRNSKLEPFTCPTNHIQLGLLIGFFVLAFIIFGIGVKMTNVMKPIFMAVGGFMMFILPFYVIKCDLYLSLLVWIISIAMFASAIAAPFSKNSDEWD